MQASNEAEHDVGYEHRHNLLYIYPLHTAFKMSLQSLAQGTLLLLSPPLLTGNDGRAGNIKHRRKHEIWHLCLRTPVAE